MGKGYGLTFPIPYNENKKKGVFGLKKRIKLIGLVLLSCLMVACQSQQSNNSNNQGNNNEITSELRQSGLVAIETPTTSGKLAASK